MKDLLVIYNPYSGKKKNIEKLKKEMIKIASLNNYNIEFVETSKKDDATDIMKSIREYDLVISMGGDGTFNEVTKGNLQRQNKLLLSHLPVGTTNDLKSSFGFNGDTISIFNSILEGKNVTYDILSVNDIPFVYTAGFGKFLNIPYETCKKDKTKFGYFAYINNGIVDLLKNKIKLYDIEYEINGYKKNIKTPLVLISNSSRVAGMKFYSNVQLNDGEFEVMIAKTKSIIKLAIGIIQIKMGKSSNYFKLVKTNNIKFKINDSIKNWCIDGEKLETNPQEYNVKIMEKIKCRVDKNAKNYQ